MSPGDVSQVGPWAREKLDALGRYLDYYTKVLKNQRHWLKGTAYVDAFAGAGYALLRRAGNAPAGSGTLLGALDPAADDQAAAFLRGSPRVALEIANPFDRYIFIEHDAERAVELERLRAEFAGRRTIEIRQGDAQTELQALLDAGLGARHQRAVVFLDPFGMQLSWSLLERLGATGTIEVLINFPLGMAIQRLLSRNAQFQPGWRAALDRYFGTAEWYDRVYFPERDLFGDRIKKRENADVTLLKWYCGRLVQTFGHVSSARLIRSTRGNPLYYLIWAGPHRKGLKGADYILRMGEAVA